MGIAHDQNVSITINLFKFFSHFNLADVLKQYDDTFPFPRKETRFFNINLNNYH